MIDYKNFKVEVLGALYDCGNRLRRRKMLSLLPETEGKIILEVGCGIGDFAIALSQKKGAYKEYIGIDISLNNLRTAKQLINKSKLSNDILLVQADIFKLPFNDESVDILICAEVLEHLDDAMAMCEIKRVLKKEGNVLITVPYLGKPVAGWGHLRHYDLAMIKKLASDLGFVIKKFNIFGRFHEISWVKLKRIFFRIWGVWKKISHSKTEYYASVPHRNLIMPIGDKALFIDDLFAQPKSIIGSKGYVVVLLQKI